MLYRMGRYGGLPALRGMLPSDPPWVRPLLGVRRAHTEAFCRDRGLEYAVDKGNVYPGYARTGLREHVLPAWEAALPGAAEAAARTAEVAAEAERVLASVLEGVDISLQSPHLEVPRVRLLSSPVRRLLLHAWLDRREGPESTRADVLAVEGLVAGHGSGELDLAGGWHVRRECDLIRLSRPVCARSPQAVPEAVVLQVPGSVVWNGVRIGAEAASRFCAPDPEREIYVDAACVTEPLLVRGIEAGDRMRPLGLGGSRKLQDILVDLHVPASRRSSIPVVVCGRTILWVCGLVSAEQGRITAQTGELVRLSVEREQSER
jgi:tRNA(Ile)-lysidine synthase